MAASKGKATLKPPKNKKRSNTAISKEVIGDIIANRENGAKGHEAIRKTVDDWHRLLDSAEKRAADGEMFDIDRARTEMAVAKEIREGVDKRFVEHIALNTEDQKVVLSHKAYLEELNAGMQE